MSQLNIITHINGMLSSSLDPRDRGLAYGDGLFETCRVFNGQIPLWKNHNTRLLLSAKYFQISIENKKLNDFVKTILESALSQEFESGVLKIVVTRGAGGRGYKFPESSQVNIILSFYPDDLAGFEPNPAPIALGLCRMRLGQNTALAGHKHLNRLENVLARNEWSDDKVIDSILRNSEGLVVECTAHNVFAVMNNSLITPRLNQCGVMGVMRELIRTQLTNVIGCQVIETSLTLEELQAADAIFICNSNYGVRPVLEMLDENSVSVKAFNDYSVALQLQNALLAHVACS